ncbi:MAG: response regulator [Spirulina sp.]
MQANDPLIEWADRLIYDRRGEYLSDLQRAILLEALQGNRKTYEQISEAVGYSSRYIRQKIAPQLWQLLSDAIGEKVGKNNVRNILARYQKQEVASPQTIPKPESTIATPPEPEPTIASSLQPTLAPPQPDTEERQTSILLVDDRPENLSLLSDMLENEGYRVRQAIDGVVALKSVLTELPDLILLDVNMPNMDGYTVCQNLKGDPRTQPIPVIFMSALNEPWNKVQAFAVGGSDYITKPFKVIEVIARIENQLQICRLQTQVRQMSARFQHAQAILKQLKILDAATGMLDRDRFDLICQQILETAQQEQTPVSLICCRIQPDARESVPAFDIPWHSLTQTIAEAVVVTLPQQDYFMTAYNGQTLAILLPQTHPATGEKVVRAISQSLQLSHKNLSIELELLHPSSLSDLVASCDRTD